MRDWIAGAMTVLGTLLVLSGAVIIVIRAWYTSGKPTEPPAGEATAPTAGAFSTSSMFGASTTEPRERGWRGLLRMSPPDRLIAWGIILLVLAAVAAGAISFDLGAAAPPK